MPKKILNFLDQHFLKIGIGFLLAFIPLYPKFPLFDIRHTWVYIRLEDLLILAIVIIWFIQLLRRKVSFITPLTIPIFAYWLAGGISLLFSLLFLSGKLANFFPNVAILHYLRRIEYIIPFFIAFSTIKSLKDIKDYLWIISLTLLGVIFYGFGQRYLGFPAFLTMNEEFAKGLPLYLPPTARVTSTFAGHYDLAAFLVLMIVLLGSLIFGLRYKLLKIGLFLLVFLAFILLLFTASRISFAVYLVAVSFMLYLQEKKWLILPVVLVSIILMSYISGASERFSKTLRVERVVYSTKTGQPIAVLEEPSVTEKEASKEESLPLGTGFLTVPLLQKTPEATTVATIRRAIISSLKTATTSSEIATISGNFLIRRAIVYDISFTTRFQGEWPRAWEAFRKNPILGSGYSSISLATDNDYLRALGETGILGFLTFSAVFFVIILILRRALKVVMSLFERSVIIGVGAGLFALLLNASLIDIFEASKLAFPFWMILGISFGVISLRKTPEQSLFQEAWEVVRLKATHFLILLGLMVLLFAPALGNYFVGDDFTWLRWAAISSKSDILNFFLWADGFFYRPLAKSYLTLVYPFLELRPSGYHLVDFLLHFGSTVAIYFSGLLLTKKKLIALLASFFFLLLPVSAESVLWISSTSITLAVFFYLWSFLFYFLASHREESPRPELGPKGKVALHHSLSGEAGQSFEKQRGRSLWWRPALFILSLLSFALGIFSHEIALTLPLLLFFCDWLFIQKPKRWLLRFLPLLPYFLIIDVYLWLRVGAGAHGLSGDYSYRLSNFLFNLFGNLWGYLGLLVAGENFIPLYDFSRLLLRVHKFWASGGIFVLLLIILTLTLWHRSKIKEWFNIYHFRVLFFACGWFTITLLPFLGLGNIAERYVYLASAAFVLALALLVDFIWGKIQKKNTVLAFTVSVALIIGLVGFYWRGMAQAQQNWRKSGETANKILLAISSNYADFPEGTTLYFVDLPIRQGRAWIFPVGLKDGLWFIYRDETLKIEKANDVEAALDLAEENKPSHVFVFENDNLKEAIREEVVQEK